MRREIERRRASQRQAEGSCGFWLDRLSAVVPATAPALAHRSRAPAMRSSSSAASSRSSAARFSSRSRFANSSGIRRSPSGKPIQALAQRTASRNEHRLTCMIVGAGRRLHRPRGFSRGLACDRSPLGRAIPYAPTAMRGGCFGRDCAAQAECLPEIRGDRSARGAARPVLSGSGAHARVSPGTSEQRSDREGRMPASMLPARSRTAARQNRGVGNWEALTVGWASGALLTVHLHRRRSGALSPREGSAGVCRARERLRSGPHRSGRRSGSLGCGKAVGSRSGRIRSGTLGGFTSNPHLTLRI